MLRHLSLAQLALTCVRPCSSGLASGLGEAKMASMAGTCTQVGPLGERVEGIMAPGNLPQHKLDLCCLQCAELPRTARLPWAR